MKRRDFLKFIGVGAIAMTLGNFETSIARRKHRRIDFHAHAILPSYINGLKKLGIDAVAEEGFPLPKWSVEDHLKFMNDAQIDFTILSMPTPHIYNGDEKLSCEVAMEINDEFAEICQKISRSIWIRRNSSIAKRRRINRGNRSSDEKSQCSWIQSREQ